MLTNLSLTERSVRTVLRDSCFSVKMRIQIKDDHVSLLAASSERVFARFSLREMVIARYGRRFLLEGQLTIGFT